LKYSGILTGINSNIEIFYPFYITDTSKERQKGIVLYSRNDLDLLRIIDENGGYLFYCEEE